LFRGGSESFGVVYARDDKKGVEISDLDKYASENWESILHFIAGIQSKEPPSGVSSLLLRSGLMQQARYHSSCFSPQKKKRRKKRKRNSSFFFFSFFFFLFSFLFLS
jgi:hypothetical protein